MQGIESSKVFRICDFYDKGNHRSIKLYLWSVTLWIEDLKQERFTPFDRV